MRDDRTEEQVECSVCGFYLFDHPIERDHYEDCEGHVSVDHLTRLRDQRDEAREALDIFASLDRLIERKMDLTEARDQMDNVRVEYRGETYWLKKYHLETARRALGDADESEGRGGGEAEQKAELERAARAVRDALQTEIKVDDAPGAIIQWYERMFDRLDAALDELEGRGGGENCDECGHPINEHGYSGCDRCGCDHDALPDLPGPDLQPGDPLERAYIAGVTQGWCDASARYEDPDNDSPEMPDGYVMQTWARRYIDNAHTPDPSEGEVGCDHENTVLDDNVEWCPDCRRVMPEDAEDAEDDGRGEGRLSPVDFMHPDQFNRRCEDLADDLDWQDGSPQSADGLEEMAEAYCTLWREVFGEGGAR